MDASHSELKEQIQNFQSNQHQQLAAVPALGVPLEQCELNSKGIPLVLDLVTTKLLSRPEYLSTEGIFRINSSI